MAEPFEIGALRVTADAPNPFVEDELRLIDRLIEERLVDISYQPIVHLESRSIFAYEALARPRDGYFRTPDDLIESACRARCMGKLGRYLRTLSLSGCERWPLFVNLNAHEFADPYLVQPDEPILAVEAPVYLEISEAVPAEYVEQCRGVLAELRRKGILLAIDDFGAGSSSLKSIVDLEPDVVKLHRDLIIGCLPRTREFGLLRSLTDLCHRMGAKVIAEGIETVDELKACLAAGIDYGQGFLLSVPHNPPPSFFWPPELPPDSTVFLKAYESDELATSDTRRRASAGTGDTVSDTSRPPSTGSGKTMSKAEAELASARVTIRRLEDELAETNNELTEVLIERSALAEKVKRLSLKNEPAPSRERTRAPSTPIAAPPPAAAKKSDSTPDRKVDDALDFLRHIEEERARKQGSDS